MVSLPSGSREDVELVLIETEYFSLVIKGKPYHERYEGLKSNIEAWTFMMSWNCQ